MFVLEPPMRMTRASVKARTVVAKMKQVATLAVSASKGGEIRSSTI